MRTKNSKPLTDAERKHLAMVKSLPCGLTGAPPPSMAHHIIQGNHFTTIPLSYDAHQHPKFGWHGEKVLWKINKKTPEDILNDTIRKLFY